MLRDTLFVGTLKRIICSGNSSRYSRIRWDLFYMVLVIPANHFAYKQFIKYMLSAVGDDCMNLHVATFQQNNVTCY
jgi:hypothetical protein